MFGAQIVPSAIFFILMLAVPESVRWLVKNGQKERAGKILARLADPASANRELAEIERSLNEEAALSKNSFRELFSKGMAKILALGMFIAVLQQWCGMNVVFYYAADIFQAAGYDLKAMMLQIVVIGSIMVVSTALTIAIVDKIGRKFLMLLGTSGLALIYLIEGLMFMWNVSGISIVILTLASVAIYSLTLAPAGKAKPRRTPTRSTAWPA